MVTGSSATLGTFSDFSGKKLSQVNSITVNSITSNSGASVNGNLYALGGAITYIWYNYCYWMHMYTINVIHLLK